MQDQWENWPSPEIALPFAGPGHPTETAPPGENSGPRLNVLVLDEEIPFPLNSGKRIRTWNLLRNLSHRHAVTFLCYAKPGNPGIAKMESLGIRVATVHALPAPNSFRFYAGALANLLSLWPYSVSRHHTRRFSKAVRQLTAAQNYDLVQCEWTPYASYENAIGNLPTVVMAHNIEATVWRRRAKFASSLPERIYMRLQAWKMARFEKRCFSRATQVVAVTAVERETAISWGARATDLVSNGVDTEYLQPSEETVEPDSLLFLGSLDWQPNRDALQYLLREILPCIQAADPQARLRIVGRQPATKLREQVEGLPGVEWMGEVPDIRPCFAQAAVVLVPLRIGGGSRIKILESLSMAKAVVTTRIGAEGLDVVSGEHCLIADTPTEFSQCVVQLLNSPEQAAELGKNGRSLVKRQYDWSRLAHTLEGAWKEAAGAAHLSAKFHGAPAIHD